ncbi:MAG: hypothetical protein AB8F74_03225 [Saprospiraceae bacterium]
MNNLLSKAYLAAERFITFHNFSQNKSLQNNLLTKELQKRSIDDWFNKEIEKSISQLEEKSLKDWEDHMELLQLLQHYYHHPNLTPVMESGKSLITSMDEQLELVYILEKAATITKKIFRNRILKDESYDIRRELDIWFKLTEQIIHPSITLFKVRFSYTEDNRLENYHLLKATFLEEIHNLNDKEKKLHLIYLTNDTALLTRTKQLDLSARLPLYKLGLKHGLLMYNGLLTHKTFISILTISNTFQDFDYSTWFIDNYVKYLDSMVQDDAQHWALAHTAYYQKFYNECLNILLGYDFSIHFFKIITKVLTIQVYFDLFLKDISYESYLFNFFDSFEKWLQREKFRSKYNKSSFLKFIQLSRKLAKSFMEHSFSENNLRKIIHSETNIQAPTWLNQKMEQIIELNKKR